MTTTADLMFRWQQLNGEIAEMRAVMDNPKSRRDLVVRAEELEKQCREARERVWVQLCVDCYAEAVPQEKLMNERWTQTCSGCQQQRDIRFDRSMRELSGPMPTGWTRD